MFLICQAAGMWQYTKHSDLVKRFGKPESRCRAHIAIPLSPFRMQQCTPHAVPVPVASVHSVGRPP